MLTIRAATTLLAQANSLDALATLAGHLGFDTPLLDVSPTAQTALGVTPFVQHARVGRGLGALRVMVARLANTTDPPVIASATDARELTRRLVSAVVHHAPTRLWLVVTINALGDSVSIATGTPHPQATRVSALRVDRAHVVDSDADTLRALAAAPREHDHLCHARWTDILGRDALSGRFYRTLEHLVRHLAHSATGSATAGERDELALLCASRLLFLAFLEAKGWLAGNRAFLLHHCTATLERGGQLHQRFLRPLFFGTLNTPLRKRAQAARAFGAVPFLNGGLFAATPLERKRATVRFTDDAIVALIGDLLDRFRFTAREDSSTWSEAAVDPEMLGRAFECLMAADERKSSGSYYTPPSLVEQVVRDALQHALPALPIEALHTNRLHDSTHTTPHPGNPHTLAQLHRLRILDPACGSGAFLVHMLELLATLATRSGDTRPAHLLRRDILTRSIFGVDRNPMAVWLCELRLWLSVVIECPESDIARVPPLPNLDHHIRVGDTLAGGDFRFAPPSARALTTLRERYTRATGRRKQTLGTALDREERARAVGESTRMIDAITRDRRALIANLRRRDLFGLRTPPSRTDRARLLQLRTRLAEARTHRRKLEFGAALPFRFTANFADVAATGGFHIILGNPPWVRPHHLALAERTRLRRDFRTLRDAPWRAGASRAGAGAGFAAQADLSVAFVERATTLLAPQGVLALLLPAKLWRALAGGGVRRFLLQHTRVASIHDWSDAHALFDAATYPSLLVAIRTGASRDNDPPADDHCNALHDDAPVHVTVARKQGQHAFTVPARSLSLAGDPAAPWLLLPPPVRAAFERLRRAGTPLGDSHIGRPLLGVKCGCNAAFLVQVTEHDDDTATIHADNHHATVERHLLRPALRGDAIAGSGTSRKDLRILWTHSADGAPLRTLPPRAGRWLARWRPRLESRRDARARLPWWTLFRTEAARCETPRLVWADIGKRLRTTVLAPGDPTVPLNTCYVLRTGSLDDAFALDALLTSPIAAAWLDALAEPARGGWRRFLGWTVAALPVPEEWTAMRPALAALARRRAVGDPPSVDEHVALTADAYGISIRAISPLLEWWQR